jgi:hypothetical protein
MRSARPAQGTTVPATMTSVGLMPPPSGREGQQQAVVAVAPASIAPQLRCVKAAMPRPRTGRRSRHHQQAGWPSLSALISSRPTLQGRVLVGPELDTLPKLIEVCQQGHSQGEGSRQVPLPKLTTPPKSIVLFVRVLFCVAVRNVVT